MALEKELEVFEENKERLLQTARGLFVLIKEKEVFGPFATAEIAYEDGLRRFGLKPFLVKQVLEEEPVGFVPVLFLVPRSNASL